ncbi:uncharacterized protein LOC116917314 [Daphnia magna]|uniref:Uncharacterized protein n=1 Tax=Daphnia magna TaxID=35525 RepID=A0A0P5WG92_9CRUS|nr:uncharacterized protein LOC116917314 [Daphnia magna]KZS05725.1 Uncharacterized protein APZ42_030972 [Daphnia magna]
MSCAESSDGERAVSPTAAATVRERRRLRLLKRRWNHGAISNNNSVNNNSGMVLSFSAFRRARRVRNQRRMTKEEYLRLKNMVPAVATQPRVSKVQVIEEAIKYIDSLHVALFQRLRAQELASTTASDTTSTRGPAQVTGNESDVQMESSQLCRWIGHVLPTPHALTTAHLLVTERQQQREGIKQRPFFMDKVDCLIRKKQS